MSVSLVSSPVETVSGVVHNLFAGFERVEYTFSRKDMTGISVGAGIGDYIRVTTTSDLTSELSVGDKVYVYAEGATYTYDEVGTITAISTTDIDLDISYIESASGNAYINYHKNWYLECELVNVDNVDVKVLPFTLKDDGNNQGDVVIDVSIANDKNLQTIEYQSQLLEDDRIIFTLRYREVYESVTGGYVNTGEEIILVYATQNPTVESFLNRMDNPKMWKGYPYGIVLSHSSQNSDDVAIEVTFDELDINQSNLTTANSLTTFDSDDEGLLFNNFDKSFSFDTDTEYIKFNADYIATLAFFDGSFFDSTFFATT